MNLDSPHRAFSTARRMTMGFRHFPGESPKKQRKGRRPCCSAKTLKEWNCDCSWGCETCWVSHRCSKCGAMFGPAVAKEIMEETK